jgi:DNA repair protein RadA/Sms
MSPQSRYLEPSPHHLGEATDPSVDGRNHTSTNSHESGGLLAVGQAEYEELPVSEALSWFKQRLEKFVVGGIYLVAGHPGIGKSALGIQIALDLGKCGEKTLYVLTEQSREDLARRARRLSSDWPATEAKRALASIQPEDNIYDIETLPSFLAHQVMSPSGKYHGVRLIVVDSVQGHGLSATATRKYKQLYEFCRQCKSAGITVLLVAHVTKKGDIAGPKDLEHNVDCVVVMRKAMIYRPLFVPKNRFGPAVFKPVPLEMNKRTTGLILSPHSESVSSVARAYLGRQGGIAEAQAAVSLPAYGTRGKITAPVLPKKEIEQLTTCIGQLPDMEIEDLDYIIQCRLPGERRYKGMLGLSLCMALIASYIQRDIPPYYVYLGEIDLLRKVREVPDQIIMDLCEEIQEGKLSKPLRVFCPPEEAKVIRDLVAEGVTAIGCDRLDDAVMGTWPELSAGSQRPVR